MIQFGLQANGQPNHNDVCDGIHVHQQVVQATTSHPDTYTRTRRSKRNNIRLCVCLTWIILLLCCIVTFAMLRTVDDGGLQYWLIALVATIGLLTCIWSYSRKVKSRWPDTWETDSNVRIHVQNRPATYASLPTSRLDVVSFTTPTQMIGASGSRNTEHLANQSRNTEHLANQSRNTEHLANQSRNTEHLANQSRNTGHLGNQSMQIRLDNRSIATINQSAVRYYQDRPVEPPYYSDSMRSTFELPPPSYEEVVRYCSWNNNSNYRPNTHDLDHIMLDRRTNNTSL